MILECRYRGSDTSVLFAGDEMRTVGRNASKIRCVLCGVRNDGWID